MKSPARSYPIVRAFSSRHLFRFIATFLAATVWSVAAAEGGAITGSVSNAATGNNLEGARIELPRLGLSALTDATGRFTLNGVPSGVHEVTATYTGLDAVRSEVTVRAGERAVRNFDLTTAIYQLDQIKVTGEREGNALAITMQREAPNVKNVVAMDAFGNLPNLSASEIAIMLPGVSGELSSAGLIDGFTIRGAVSGQNAITVDGTLFSSQGGMTRTTRINNLTGAMFEQLELTKGHTPDKGADSLGGTINLKSRSPLSIKEKRRINYSAAVRGALPFTEQIPLRESHRYHPLFNLGYQEVFSVAGGDRNLGVAVNLFYSENVGSSFRSTRDFQNTTADPAYVWDYRTQDDYNNRKQSSMNIKFDYRLSPTTKLSLNLIGNNGQEFNKFRLETRAFTAQTVGTTGTAGILPGYTDRITQVRASASSNIDQNTQGPNNFYLRLRHAELGAEQEFGPLALDYNAGFSRTNINSGSGKSGNLTMRISNIGWILDRTQNDLYPRFVQTEGADFLNPANYRPIANGLAGTDNQNDHEIHELRANAKYTMPTRVPVAFKAGFQWRDQTAKDLNRSYRYSYIGTGPLPSSPLVMFDEVKTGRKMPQWESSMFVHDRTPDNPALWREDVYFREMTKFTGTRDVTETVTAGYAMAQGKFGAEGALGRTSYLAGVRREKTETESHGYVRNRVPSSAAQQTSDPVGAATRDYAGNRRELHGGYTKSFPSVHLTHDINRNFKARLSWSTSFGRPSMSNLLPNETVSENNRTLTVNNPSLLPMTAANWDATLDYYFEPVGNLSVGWFHKTLKDYIVTGIDGGVISATSHSEFNAEYGGYTLLTSANAGTAYVQGWEISYQQQFTFLPGILKRLSFAANYTSLDTHGDFGSNVPRSSGQVAGFVPRTGNASLSWRYRALSARVLVNYTGHYITSYSAASEALNLYRDRRTITNVGVGYQLRPSVMLNL
ncbi:MAG TPA: TonB-dependent receptor, partial [Opitutaceae bacterium]|nr:TonB-dependent receptor [Opitutaceae bacterium]